jgi:hypothetical protein
MSPSRAHVGDRGEGGELEGDRQVACGGGVAQLGEPRRGDVERRRGPEVHRHQIARTDRDSQVEVGLGRVHMVQELGLVLGGGPEPVTDRLDVGEGDAVVVQDRAHVAVGEAVALRRPPMGPAEERDGVEARRSGGGHVLDERDPRHGHVAEHELSLPSGAAVRPSLRHAAQSTIP